MYFTYFICCCAVNGLSKENLLRAHTFFFSYLEMLINIKLETEHRPFCFKKGTQLLLYRWSDGILFRI